MTRTALRIIFAGTPDFSALHLDALIDSKHQLQAVFTQPDRPSGRGKKLQASAVKQRALDAGLTVYQPASLKSEEAQQHVAGIAADVLVVVAYGLILPPQILQATPLGCLNVHASLLPRWRGAAPIQRAIEAGDEHTGITIMQMDAGLDTGAMLATETCAIGPTTSAADLHDQLAEIGPGLLLKVLDDLPQYQQAKSEQQEQGVTYAHKILKPEAQIDWAETATVLDRKIRAFNPFPVCYSLLPGRGKVEDKAESERVRVWQARPIVSISPQAKEMDVAPGTILEASDEGILVSCGTGQLLLEKMQLPGGKTLTAAQVLTARSTQFAPGLRFETPTAGSH